MVQNRPRTPGRPRSFDLDEALDRAARVFWAKGYEGASLDDLTEAMGIGRPSLYAAFTDKRTLFLRCLDRYAGAAMPALDGPVRAAIGRLLRAVAEGSTGRDTPPGCLIASVAPGCAVAVEGVADFLAAAVRAADAALEARLRAAVDDGELPAGFPVAARARRAADFMRALAFRARAGATRAELLADAEDAADLVLRTDAADPDSDCASQDRSPPGEARTGRSLIDALRSTPSRDLEPKPDRLPMPVRSVDL